MAFPEIVCIPEMICAVSVMGPLFQCREIRLFNNIVSAHPWDWSANYRIYP